MQLNNPKANRPRFKEPDQKTPVASGDKVDAFFENQKRIKRLQKIKAARERQKPSSTKIFMSAAQKRLVVAHKKAKRLLILANIKMRRLWKKHAPAVIEHKRLFALGVGTSLAIVFLIGSAVNYKQQRSKSGNDSDVAGAGSVQGAKVATDVKPGFNVLSPKGSDEKQDLVKYDATRKTASIAVQVGGINAILSQQEINSEQIDDEFFLLNVAQSFNINKEIESKKGPVFIGSNIEDGVTTIIFTYETYLVFIRSTDKIIDDAVAISFINTLQ